MKNNKLGFCFLLILFSSCLYETPPIIHSFKIINSTNRELYIESKTIDDLNTKYDTIKIGETYIREIKKYYCYDDYYKDSLIISFFKILKINTPNKKINLNFLDRNNWKEKLELTGNSCKSGNAFYEIEVYDKYIN